MILKDVLKEVDKIRRVLHNVPVSVHIEGDTENAVEASTLEMLAAYGKMEATLYIVFQMVSFLENDIEEAIERQEEADRKWREEMEKMRIIETFEEGPATDGN